MQSMDTVAPENVRLLDNVTLLGIDCIDIDRLVFAAEVCQRHLRFKDVRLLSHLPHARGQVTRIEPITSVEQYSTFVLKEAHRYVETSHVLIIQWDGFILNPFAWDDAFLDYDYIGAPWLHSRIDDQNVGNGGFSLRSRRLMQTMSSFPIAGPCHPEDVIICRTYREALKASGFTFAPEDLAGRFSVEGPRWEGQFGFHRSDISGWDIERFADVRRHGKYIAGFWSHVLAAKRRR